MALNQFQVPQFIDYEAKLLGPFTLKQSAILGFGGVILFILWFIVEQALFFLLAVLIVVIIAALTFVRVNGRPMIALFTSLLSFFVSPQLYIWQKRKEKRGKSEKLIKKGGEDGAEKETKELTKNQILALVKKISKQQ